MDIHLDLRPRGFKGKQSSDAAPRVRIAEVGGPSRAIGRDGRSLDAERHLPQKDKRTPSWIWRFGKAEVKASGVLGVAACPFTRSPGRIPCTLNEVLPPPNQGAAVGRAKSGFTSLFTLAKFVRFAMLNPSAVNCRLALSPSLYRQVKRASKSK